MSVSIAWLGVSTFRVHAGDLVVYLDAYIERVPAAPPVGVSIGDIDRADFVIVGHSHFDHVWGAERIAVNTGATIVGSYETARIMYAAGVPREQVMPVSGGEPVRLSDDVLLRVFPGLHSCIWASAPHGGADEACLGDTGVSHQERMARLGSRGGARRSDGAVAEHLRASAQGAWGDGGALAYLLETPEGTIFWNDTSGAWTGMLRGIKADVAILAAAGRANVDGEPVQGSMAGFVADEAELLRPDRVVLCHHDDWMPPFTRALDPEPIAAELKRRGAHAELLELDYNEDRRVLG
jgi:L-ascorbate metabolism protein UlaG (beta-lactamase superfamily)